MQNLGYFQLQAQPGLFSLRLAEGRASELYTIAGVTGNAVEERDLPIPVRSFNDENQRLVVQKRPGMETVSLLEDTDGEDVAPRGSGGVAGSMWNSLNSIWSGSKAVTSTSSKDEDNRVHVFSLATGHLYERLLRIMMLSVTRHCSRPVKFWLFENYLSPSFKALAQSMTETYGFEVW